MGVIRAGLMCAVVSCVTHTISISTIQTIHQGMPHTHSHVHGGLKHKHAHTPDMHHQHRH